MAKAQIAVIGAGLMGHGIAQVFALAGHEVTIYDQVMASLDSAKSHPCEFNRPRRRSESRRARDSGR
jgi:3-hydroxyacyl-CoA dehydrogenase